MVHAVSFDQAPGSHYKIFDEKMFKPASRQSDQIGFSVIPHPTPK